MFYQNDIVKILIPNVVNTGYDYRLTQPAEIGAFVRVSVMNHPYIGVIIGIGDSGLPIEKIKPVQTVFNFGLNQSDLIWIKKMSDWTMMPMGAVLKLILNIPDAFSDPKTEPLYIINLDNKIRITESRQAVADAFSSNDNEPMTVVDIQNIARVSSAVIRTMIKNEILLSAGDREKINAPIATIKYFDTKSVTLNSQQQTAADEINISGFGVYLLDGITGSGKTQVYFDSVMRAYESNKNILIMMPEIALTAQFIKRFMDRFGGAPIIWHSNLTAARRREIWRGVASGEIRIVIGTRSALFLPWKNLGLIVVDEEHDNSYKQEDMGNYHARDMAILRAKLSDFPVILASATPSAETIKNINDGKYKHLRLTSRFAGASLPTIELIDLRTEKSDDKKTVGNLSGSLCNAISDTLAAGQQVMLFINRRGYAPIIQCKKCGWVATCPDCSVGMTMHKKIEKLLCHICGRTAVVPKICPECGATEISTRGMGIEKIAEEVAEKFPHARTSLVSSDTIMSRQALERLVAQMESGEIDIIIGTQILAKGHHFPNLTLVGVIDADMGLFGTDFRAAEKTFSQLFQVSGRAGRGEIAGRVMMQTYQPDHPVLGAIITNDRDKFMAMDMAGRMAAKMPPYGQLIAVVIEAQKESVLQEYCKKLSDAAPKLMTDKSQGATKIMGPIPAQIYQIRNWYRMRFLISGDERAALQPIVSHWIAKVKQPANLRVKIDVSPQNFM